VWGIPLLPLSVIELSSCDPPFSNTVLREGMELATLAFEPLLPLEDMLPLDVGRPSFCGEGKLPEVNCPSEGVLA